MESPNLSLEVFDEWSDGSSLFFVVSEKPEDGE